MAGGHLSFVADPSLVSRVKEIARADGTTASKAAARAAALGTMLPAASRRTLQKILADGNDEVRQALVALLTRAVAQAGNMMVEQQLLEAARAKGLGTGPQDEHALAEEAALAVDEYRRKERVATSPAPGSGGIGR